MNSYKIILAVALIFVTSTIFGQRIKIGSQLERCQLTCDTCVMITQNQKQEYICYGDFKAALLVGLSTSSGTDDQLATEVPYSNTVSGATATNTQAAIDELFAQTDNDPLPTNELADVSVSITAPASPKKGDIWKDTTTDELKVWTGASWIVVSEDSTDDQNATEVSYSNTASGLNAITTQSAIDEVEAKLSECFSVFSSSSSYGIGGGTGTGKVSITAPIGSAIVLSSGAGATVSGLTASTTSLVTDVLLGFNNGISDEGDYAFSVTTPDGDVCPMTEFIVVEKVTCENIEITFDASGTTNVSNTSLPFLVTYDPEIPANSGQLQTDISAYSAALECKNADFYYGDSGAVTLLANYSDGAVPVVIEREADAGVSFQWYDVGEDNMKVFSTSDPTAWFSSPQAGTYNVVVPSGDFVDRIAYVTSASGGDQNVASGGSTIFNISTTTGNNSIADGTVPNYYGINGVTGATTYPNGTLTATNGAVATWSSGTLTYTITGLAGGYPNGSKLTIFNLINE